MPIYKLDKRTIALKKQLSPTLILITGHPATGKTTLARRLGAHFKLPAFCKDDGKEILFDHLGTGDRAWGRKLGVTSFELLYWQAEVMLRAGTSCLIEGNFAPEYANIPWQRLQNTYQFKCVQLLCSAEVEVVMQRYNQRIADGTRHPGHFDASAAAEMRDLLTNHPAEWIDLSGERISVETTHFDDAEFEILAQQIHLLNL